MQRAAHALADHVEKAGGLPRDQHVALAEDIAVDERRAEILRAALMRNVLGELYAVLLLEVALDPAVALVEVVAALEPYADDLLPVARMAPRVVAELRM